MQNKSTFNSKDVFLENLNLQKQALIERIPELKDYFVEIYHPGLKTNIPFLPIRCFRDFDLYNEKVLPALTLKDTEANPNPTHVTFLSSGSTNAVRAKHTFSCEGLKFYAKNSCRGFHDFLLRHNLAQNVFVISLVPPPSVWTNSSLSAMIQMFEDNGFCIKWDDFEKALENIPKDSNVIIFGTTFHHLMLIEQFKHKSKKQNLEKDRILKKFNISIIDTGGTKGKTQSFTLDEVKNIFKEFYASVSSRGLTAGSRGLDPAVKPRDDICKRDDTCKRDDINFFSEYGMCELGSQAWSLNADHDGTFVANDTLLPFAIDLQKKRVLKAAKLGSKRQSNLIGFLGFIDSVNKESYSAIITEDLGCVLSQTQRTFKLIARSPDASVKGCSLNLKNFLFTNAAWQENEIQISKLSHLITESWDKYSLSDFKKSFSSLNKLKLDSHTGPDCAIKDISTNLKNDNLKNKNILLICAANTPISFVYALIYCALNLAKKFTLKIPSLRPNDPQSENTRMKIIELFQYFANLFSKTEFILSTSKSIGNHFSQFDALFVFGTDETLQIIKSQCPPKTQFFGFGDIKNAFVVNNKKHNPKFVSEICSVWNGRGCLTPVCLFVHSTQLNTKFIISFFRSLTIAMDKRLKLLKNITFHDHNTLYIQSQFKKLGFETLTKNHDSTKNMPRILRSRYVTIVDLSQLSPDIIKQMSLDFSFGGSGFAYILPIEMKNHYPELSFKNIFPTLYEAIE